MRRFLDRLFARPQPILSEANARDARAIAALHAASFRRGWSEDEVEALLIDRDVLTHRAMTGRTLGGFIMSRIVDEEAEILSVAVAGNQRGRGLAGTLLRLHLGRLAGLAVRKVFLEVDEDNESAHRLYRRAGFREVGRREGYYPNGTASRTAALILRRDLA